MSLDVDPSHVRSNNVLLLGISYPDIAAQMEKHGYPKDVLEFKEPSVEQAVECVRRGILTEMDARDYARCVATEKATDTHVFTLSKEMGAEYRSDRHIYCDFNARNFCKTLMKAFGENIQFSQVILDYYWMPTGWLVTRWTKTLFQQTLPDLVRYQMLTVPSKRKRRRGHANGPPYDFDEGVVYLPFCAHVCKELVGAIHILKEYYSITFLDKKDLHGHALWKGTMEIDGKVMQHTLGKKLEQEEIYCRFRPKDIFESMEDPHVSKDEVMKILLAIPNYDDIRMIRLRPLRQHEKANVFRERMWAPEVGGFHGLDMELSARLLESRKQNRGKKNKVIPEIEEEKKEEQPDEPTRISRKKAEKQKTKKTNKQKTKPKARSKKQPLPLPLSRHSEQPADAPKRPVRIGENVTEVETRSMEEIMKCYPCPARDLETYINTQETIEADNKEFNRSLNARKENSSSRSDHKMSSPRKNQAHGNQKVGSDEQNKKCVDGEDPATDMPPVARVSPKYLSYNHRVAPIEESGSEDAIELDWAFALRDEKLNFTDVGTTADADTANSCDLAAASNLFHGLRNGLDAPNKVVNGAMRAARTEIEPNQSKEINETVCFAIDTNEMEPEDFIGYDLMPPEKLRPLMTEFSKPSVADTLACITGQWEHLLTHEDQCKFRAAASKLDVRTLRVMLADKSHRNCRIDRKANHRNILRWILFGRMKEHDLEGCFGLIEKFLIEQKIATGDDNSVALASKIEGELYQQLRNACVQGSSTSDQSELFRPLRNWLKHHVDLTTEAELNDAASTILSLGSERVDLRSRISSWLQSGMAPADDPGGLFDAALLTLLKHKADVIRSNVKTNTVSIDDSVLTEMESTLKDRLMGHPSSIDGTKKIPRKFWDALGLLRFQRQEETIPFVLEDEERNVPFFITETLKHMKSRGWNNFTSPIIACKHCDCVEMQSNDNAGSFELASVSAFGSPLIWRKMSKHIMQCEYCPSGIKQNMATHLPISDCDYAVLDGLSDFFSRLWHRITQASAIFTLEREKGELDTNQPCKNEAPNAASSRFTSTDLSSRSSKKNFRDGHDSFILRSPEEEDKKIPSVTDDSSSSNSSPGSPEPVDDNRIHPKRKFDSCSEILMKLTSPDDCDDFSSNNCNPDCLDPRKDNILHRKRNPNSGSDVTAKPTPPGICETPSSIADCFNHKHKPTPLMKGALSTLFMSKNNEKEATESHFRAISPICPPTSKKSAGATKSPALHSRSRKRLPRGKKLRPAGSSLLNLTSKNEGTSSSDPSHVLENKSGTSCELEGGALHTNLQSKKESQKDPMASDSMSPGDSIGRKEAVKTPESGTSQELLCRGFFSPAKSLFKSRSNTGRFSQPLAVASSPSGGTSIVRNSKLDGASKKIRKRAETIFLQKPQRHNASGLGLVHIAGHCDKLSNGIDDDISPAKRKRLNVDTVASPSDFSLDMPGKSEEMIRIVKRRKCGPLPSLEAGIGSSRRAVTPKASPQL